MKKLLVVLIIIFVFCIDVKNVINYTKDGNLRKSNNAVIFEEIKNKETCSKEGLEKLQKEREKLKKEKERKEFEEKIKNEDDLRQIY